MTVQELIDHLREYPGDRDVMIVTKNPFVQQKIRSVSDDTHSSFGNQVPCVILSDKSENV